ncbi:Conserved_hypothetical protein [Hexamita inflata]|uniref:Uncharacterized protein n=1 Tax=Hexamita inflata TaxID=28002 RepID=A0AA86R5K8_9EUKA|nr:Conserved hypothetical protein [Hexamita inflata]
MSVSPHVIICQLTEEGSKATYYAMRKFKRCWCAYACIDNKHYSSYYIGHLFTEEKILSLIPPPEKIYLDIDQFEHCSPLLQQLVNQLKITPEQGLSDYLARTESDPNYIYQKFVRNFRFDKQTLIFIDFEAFCSTPLFPSEIGAVRVLNGQVVATLHSFFTPNEEELQMLKNNQKIAASVIYTKKITAIPPPWEEPFQHCKPVARFAEFTLLNEFCTKSSDYLKQFEQVKIIKEFAEEPQFAFVGKGIHLEKKILSEMKFTQLIIETEDIFKVAFKKDPVFENIHENREFKYCAFHQFKGKGHCGLDDALYLAELVCNQKQAEEMKNEVVE